MMFTAAQWFWGLLAFLGGLIVEWMIVYEVVLM